MFAQPPKEDELKALNLAQLTEKLKKAKENAEAQRLSIEGTEGRGTTSGPTARNILKSCEREIKRIEAAIETYYSSNSNYQDGVSSPSYGNGGC